VFIVFGSTSLPLPFLHTNTTLQDQTLLTLIDKQKWVIFPSLFQSSNSNYFNHLFAFLDKSQKLTSMSFGPKLVFSLESSVGMIKFLFFIPTVNRNVLT
jgi:hypothetical protein